MRRRLSRRLATMSAGMAVAAIAGVTAPAAHAATTAPVAAAERAVPAHALPSGVIDPCPAASSGTAGCATLTTTAAGGSAPGGAARQADAAGTTPSGYAPADLRAAYDFQSATGGSGQTVAVVTPYNDPDAASDLAAYRGQYAIPPCTVADGCFRQVSQTGSASTLPETNAGWSSATSESLEMISAVCPNCHILLVEATSTAIANLGTAENEAVTLGADFVDNDWVTPETSAETGYDTYFDHPGVAITAPDSSGDTGYGAYYPAASPYVIAVGGTTLTVESTAARGYGETAWAGSGSGCSAYEPKPSWQTDTGCAGRTLNDLAALADPATPVAYYDTQTAGGWGSGSGTTVAAAIVAAAYALAGTPAPGTWPASYPYQHPGGSYTTPGTAYPYSDGLNAITSGSDGTCPVSYLCAAGPGYSGPAGLGSPSGTVSLTGAGGQAGVIYSGIADKCLDDEQGATTTGTHIQIYACNGGTTQDWTAEPDGTVRFGTATCMADSGTATTEGYHLIDLQPCDTASPAMQWTPRADGSLYNPAAGWCLADPGASTANSTQLIIGTCNGSPSQQWTIPYTRPAAAGAITSKITTAHLCLSDTDTSTANGNKIQIWQCNGDAAQTGWSVQPDGTFRIFGKCLVTQNAGTADGTLIVLWTCEGEASQFWTEQSDGSFVNKTSGTCLADPASSTTNGTQLVLHGCNQSTAEGWTLP